MNPFRLTFLSRKTEFKYLKDLMSIFERRWKQFYDNRQEYLGEDTSKVRNIS